MAETINPRDQDICAQKQRKQEFGYISFHNTSIFFYQWRPPEVLTEMIWTYPTEDSTGTNT